jgi:phospholipase C
MLVSREPGPGARNILGAWADSHDCYYYDEFLDGDNHKKQTWLIQFQSGSPNLKYGDKIRLANRFYSGQHLSRDPRPFQGEWLTTSKNGDWWTVEPGPAQV